LVIRRVITIPVIKAAIPTLLPGQTSLPVKVDLAPGHYLIVATISNQADLGMTATLIVSAATAAPVSPRPTARVTARLAQSGAGPIVPIGAMLVLLGLALLGPAALRRPRRR